MPRHLEKSLVDPSRRLKESRENAKGVPYYLVHLRTQRNGAVSLAVDLIPGWFPVPGPLGDVVVAAGLVWVAFRMIPKTDAEEWRDRARKEQNKKSFPSVREGTAGPNPHMSFASAGDEARNHTPPR